MNSLHIRSDIGGTKFIISDPDWSIVGYEPMHSIVYPPKTESKSVNLTIDIDTSKAVKKVQDLIDMLRAAKALQDEVLGR